MKKGIVAVLLLVALLLPLGGCATMREGRVYDVEAYRTTMQYYDDFKVLQLTDLHFGIETDVALQLQVVERAIETEQPDLVVLTGDNFMYASKGVVKSLISTLNAACARMTAARGGRLTKFTMTFGNHDNQGDYPRYYINKVLSSYTTADGSEIADGKYAAFVDYEDDHLFGLANFYIDLVDDRTKGRDAVDVKYRLHIIDSNTYHFMGPDYDYDVIHEEQLQHAIRVYEGATADKEYVGMAFFHIPLHEYQEAYETYQTSPVKGDIGNGEFQEDALHGYVNNGSYEALRAANIVALFCGHDHINYGDFLYRGEAILSYGVKSTNQLYHDTGMIGYKTMVLSATTVAEFVNMENVNANFKNVTGGYGQYENN